MTMGKRDDRLDTLLEDALAAGRLGVWRWDPATGRVTWSEAMERVYGLAPGEFAGTLDAFLDMVHPEDRDALHDRIERAVATDAPITGEHRIVLPDGRLRWVEARGEPLRDATGAVTAWVGVGIDVTDRKQLELHRRTDAEVLRLALDVGRMAVWTWWPDEGRLEWTAGMEQLLGLRPGALVERPERFLDMLHPEDREYVLASGAAAERTGDLDAEYRVIRPDGAVRWIERRGRRVPTAPGEPRVFVGVSIDVTERKEWEAVLDELLSVERDARHEAEEARVELQETVALLDTMLTAAPVGFAFFDVDLRLVRVNDGFAEMTGLAVEEHAGRTLEEVVPAMAASVGEKLQHVLETGEPLLEAEEVGQTAAAPGVGRFWLASYYPVRGPHDAVLGLGAVVVDVTERTRREHGERTQRALTDLLMATDLDSGELLDRVARLPVPEFADGCVVYERPRGATVPVAALAYVDPVVEARLRAEVVRAPLRADSVAPTAVAMRTGVTQLVEEFTPETRERIGAEGGYARVIVENEGSVIATPLVVAGRVIGTMSLLRSVGGRRFTEAEVAFADQLASRLAQILETRRLADEAAAARARLDMLARIGELATVELDSHARLQRAAELMLPELADACGVYLVEGHGVALVAAAHADGSRAVPGAAGDVVPLDGEHPPAIAIRTNAPLLQTDRLMDRLLEVEGDPMRRQRIDEIRPQSLLTVPLPGEDGPIGALVLAFTDRSGRVHGPDDVPLAVELARRLTPMVRHAQRFEHERDTAETLQRSLLPRELPEAPGTTVSARYLAGTTGLKVGGDWYDVMTLRDGRLLLVIGDVVGHGVRAAALMGQLRTAVRLGLLDVVEPGALVTRLNRFLLELDEAEMATCCAVVVDPTTHELQWSSAGHPPPVVRHPDGAVSFLAGPRATPLGVVQRDAYPEERVRLDEGATLVLFTDGLVERRGEPLDDGFARLAAALAHAEGTPSDVCDKLLGELLGGEAPSDDVAVLALAIASESELSLTFPTRASELAPLRAALRRWLGHSGVAPDVSADLVLALNELATNAIEHAYGLDAGSVGVHVRLAEPGVVEAVVRDRGRWRVGRRDEGGRGLPLARALVDHLGVVTGAQGTTVTIRTRTTRG